MTVRVAINGFGRIGRNILRAIDESGRKDIEVVAVNDLGPVETNAHLLRYDSVHGRFPHEVTVEGDPIIVGNGSVQGHRDQGPGAAAVEGTRRRHRARMHRHLHRPRQGRGPPHRRRQARHRLGAGRRRRPDRRLRRQPRQADQGPHRHLERVLHHQLPGARSPRCCNDAVGIEKGMMTTIHSYTGDQPTLDTMHKDLYRARAAALSHDPDLDRRGQGRRPGAARAQGQARRHLDPRADAERLGRRPQVHRQARDHVQEINEAVDRRRRTASSRASSASPISRTSRSTSTTIRIPRSWRSTRPRSWTATSCRCCPGTTMNGASPTAWPTPPSPSARPSPDRKALFSRPETPGFVRAFFMRRLRLPDRVLAPKRPKISGIGQKATLPPCTGHVFAPLCREAGDRRI